MRRRTWLALPAATALVAFAMASGTAQPQPQRERVPPSQTIEVAAIPIAAFDPRDASRRVFGALEFRGGLELSSRHPEFGGLSGLRMSPDGSRFLAISDKAHWIRGRIVYRDGAPAAIRDAEIAPMLGADGRPLEWRGWYDTEALAEDGGTLYVALERVHQIVRFDYGRHGLLARGQPIPVPPEFRRLERNRGIECLAFVPKGLPLGGTLIAFPERQLDKARNLVGYLLAGPTAGKVALKRADEFDITDCTIGPNSDLLILERRLSWWRGLAMRIRRIALSDTVPGAVLDGPILIEADLGHVIDNMEGLAVHRAPSGEVVLTLVSDDNFSPLQRTLLLQFTLLDR